MDTLIGDNAPNYFYGDARYIYDNARGGNDTLIGGNGIFAQNVLTGDAEQMHDSARGGNDACSAAEPARSTSSLASSRCPGMLPAATTR